MYSWRPLGKIKDQPSSFWTSLDTENVDVLPSTPPGAHLTFGHRYGNAVNTRSHAQPGGVVRALGFVLTNALRF